MERHASKILDPNTWKYFIFKKNIFIQIILE